MSKLFLQVECVEDLIGRADNYFGFDLCGKDSADATVFAYAEKKKPVTNADRIRAMTDEELADYLRWHNDLYSRNGMDWLDWLRQEAEA